MTPGWGARQTAASGFEAQESSQCSVTFVPLLTCGLHGSLLVPVTRTNQTVKHRGNDVLVKTT